MTPTLSVKECLVFGWAQFKKRPWIFVKAGILLGVLQMVLNVISSWTGNLGNQTTGVTLIVVALFSIAISIVSVYIGITVNNMGALTFYLKAHDDVSSVHLRDLYRAHPFWRYFLMSLLVGLAVVVGLVLFIVPGIIAGLMFSLAPYLVLEHDFRPTEAIRESQRMTKGNRWKLFLLVLAIIGINIVGAILLLVGLLVSIPVSTLAFAHAYRTLSDKATLPAAV